MFLSMPLTFWNLFEGGFCFTEWWKVGWCEVRWIRWLAELHHSACPWDCAKHTWSKSSSFPIFTNTLPDVTRRSPVTGPQSTNIGNCSRISSSWRLSAVWPSSRSSHPPSSFQPVRKHAYSLFVCLYKNFHKFCVFCSSVHELQKEQFRSMTALKDAS